VESPQRAVIEIADAVEGLFSPPDKWQQMSAAARARAKNHFNLERLESRIQKAYADLEPRNS
jgi:glycosyltransferase involved in cell wall biosynthesis